MADAARKRMTLAEFLDWEPPAGTRHWELYDGVPVMMAPPGRAHGQLAVSLGRAMDTALDNSPCRVQADAYILSPSRQASGYEADLAAYCRQDPERTDLTAPVVLVEILSASTEASDRTIKLPDHRRLPSVQEILLIDSRSVFAEVHRRMAGGGWRVDILDRAEDRLALSSIGLDVGLAELYRKVDPAEEA